MGQDLRADDAVVPMHLLVTNPMDAKGIQCLISRMASFAAQFTSHLSYLFAFTWTNPGLAKNNSICGQDCQEFGEMPHLFNLA